MVKTSWCEVISIFTDFALYSLLFVFEQIIMSYNYMLLVEVQIEVL